MLFSIHKARFNVKPAFTGATGIEPAHAVLETASPPRNMRPYLPHRPRSALLRGVSVDALALPEGSEAHSG